MVIDAMDGKEFDDSSLIFIAQHSFTLFIGISGLLVLNNILIKHKYREELQKKLDEVDAIDENDA